MWVVVAVGREEQSGSGMSEMERTGLMGISIMDLNDRLQGLVIRMDRKSEPK
jgi:hypothetical protein